jgi:chaperonin GroEL
MREPFKTIAENCGLNAEYLLENQKRSKWRKGVNFVNGETVDMIETGIIDPAKVTRCALENAVSAASTLLTTSHAVIEV